jgi:hypothetical protein
MSIVLVGSTSGSITLQEPAVSGSTVLSLPAVTGTVLTDTSPKAGNVIQVVQGTTTTVVNSSSSTYTDTTLSATITPSSSSSKVLVIVNQQGVSKTVGNTSAQFQILRGSTQILYTGDAFLSTGNTNAVRGITWSATVLDSPNTTSATTYKTQFASVANIANVSVQDYLSGSAPTSTIILMEIAA